MKKQIVICLLALFTTSCSNVELNNYPKEVKAVEVEKPVESQNSELLSFAKQVAKEDGNKYPQYLLGILFQES